MNSFQGDLTQLNRMVSFPRVAFNAELRTFQLLLPGWEYQLTLLSMAILTHDNRVSSRWEKLDSIQIMHLMCLLRQSKKKKRNQIPALFCIHCCCQGSVNEAQTTLDLLNRKGLNMQNQVLQNNWNCCKMESRVEVVVLKSTSQELQSRDQKATVFVTNVS